MVGLHPEYAWPSYAREEPQNRIEIVQKLPEELHSATNRNKDIKWHLKFFLQSFGKGNRKQTQSMDGPQVLVL